MYIIYIYTYLYEEGYPPHVVYTKGTYNIYKNTKYPLFFTVYLYVLHII